MKSIFTIILSILSLSLFSQNWDEVIKAVASDKAAGDQFGFSVSISGNKAVIGAFQDDKDDNGGTFMPEAGSVYVFELSGGVWVETAKLVASDRDTTDLFSTSVSISGDKIIVGAYLEDEDATGGASKPDAGSAYIFEFINGSWIETAKLVASDRTAGDKFGIGVSISGNKAIVGAYLEGTDATGGDYKAEAGSAYIFELSNGSWSETAKLVASDREVGNHFGKSVSINGNKVIVGSFKNSYDLTGGSPKSEAGAAYIYELNGGLWTETTKLVSSDRETGAHFGSNVSIDGNRCVVGAFLEDSDSSGTTIDNTGAAYIFEFNTGVWTETAKLVASDKGANDYFGFSLSLSGEKIVVGAFQHDGNATESNAGAAYIFELTNGIWVETLLLLPSDRGETDYFGRSVSISGNKVIVGSFLSDGDTIAGVFQEDEGAAYIFSTCVPTIPTVTVSGNTLTAAVTGVAYQWIDCTNGNIALSGETNETFTAIANGDYAVIVTEGNCMDTSDCTTITGVGIKEAKVANSVFSVYPNPTEDKLTIKTEAEINYITISDITGKVIQVINNGNKHLDVSEFVTGIYFLQLHLDQGIATTKFVVE